MSNKFLTEGEQTKQKKNAEFLNFLGFKDITLSPTNIKCDGKIFGRHYRGLFVRHELNLINGDLCGTFKLEFDCWKEIENA